MSRVVQKAMYAGESKYFFFDFASQLSPGDTGVTPSAVVSLYSGTDSPPSLAATVSISGSAVAAKLSSGVAGNIYDLAITLVGTSSAHYQMNSFIAVMPAQP